ncbi:MAG: aldehyde ferredoxin oxidoreductase C-terminal domain-containing protein [Caldisericia bacterium]|nr:aldehyde ferredoxin oxidoreductase C-terminal domain-containing protein [Caldisericia bacterium]
MNLAKIGGSLAGKILYVDLALKIIRIEKTEKYAQRFLGGRAINSFILCSEIDKIQKETGNKVKWDNPKNPLIFGVGCLVGTLMPATNRVSIDSINAFNNGKGSANIGGFWGPELKYAGYDHVVIVGKSPTPVYISINDDKIEINDASHLWGKWTSETEKLIKQALGDNMIQIMSIGPAGENLVRGAAIISGPGKSASGSGVGCIMGSKNLKAIAVRGHGAISVADPARFMEIVDNILTNIKKSPYLQSWKKGIIKGKYMPESPVWNCLASYKNGQDDFVPLEKRKLLVGEKTGITSYNKKMMACHLCPAGCMPILEIDQGPFKGTKCPNYWINSTTYSTKLGLFDPETSIRFHYMCNQLGIDGDMCSNTLAWAFECFEKGLITREDSGGIDLHWGNKESILILQKQMAHREGLGALLAEGVSEASKRLGKGSDGFAIHMKGQDTVDPYRIIKGWGFGLSVSPIGGKHLRGAVSTPDVTGPPDVEWNPTDYKNVPEIVYWQAIVKEIEDIIGNCIYVGTWSGIHALTVEIYAEILSASLGLNLNESSLMIFGRRSLNLEKAFNTMNTDFSREDDYPPLRYMLEPVKSGPFAGHKCDKGEWDTMLDRYYELQGWNKATGLQTRVCLTQLGLEDIAEMMPEEKRINHNNKMEIDFIDSNRIDPFRESPMRSGGTK